MKKALITGHHGFIGRHVAAALADTGWDIMGADITMGHDARDFFRHSGGLFDLVVHCAAVVGGRAVIDGAPLALASNFELDAGLFRWALRARPRRIVYLSSSAAYPVHLQTAAGRLCEDSIDVTRGPLVGMPDALYGWAKLTGEMLALRARAEGLNVTIVRPFSGYGEDQGEDYPFCALAGRAARRESPFTVWGPGTQVRDFVHVTDIAGAILTMVECGIDGPVNIGTGRPTSMTDLARIFCDTAGYTPAIVPKPDAPAGVAYRVADITRMVSFFTPKVTLEDGAARTMACL